MTQVPPLTAADRQERAKRMASEGQQAWADHEASREATEAKTKRLRAARLDQERAAAEAAGAQAAPKGKKAATKPIRRNIPVR